MALSNVKCDTYISANLQNMYGIISHKEQKTVKIKDQKMSFCQPPILQFHFIFWITRWYISPTADGSHNASQLVEGGTESRLWLAVLFRDHSSPERQDAGGSLWAGRSAGLVLPGVRLCQTQQRNNRFRLHRVFFISLPSTCLFPVPGLILIKFTFFITVLSGYQKSTQPVFLNVYGAPELIPRNEFRQPM
jgi:hypothetical protein